MQDDPPPSVKSSEHRAEDATGKTSGLLRWRACYQEALDQRRERLVSRIFDTRFLAKGPRRHTVAIGSAVALNVLFVLVVFQALSPLHARDPDEIRLTLIPIANDETVALPPVPEPTIPVLQMPDIVIRPDAPSSAPATIAASEVMAPRPDPEHANPAPNAGDAASAGGIVIIKILVLADGTVGDAAVVKSCGRHDVDLATMAFVRENWKFLPARVRNAVIQYWTTVAVRLA